MGAALPYDPSFNRGRANAAGLSGAPIYQEEILEIPAAINPINTCAVITDAVLKHSADAFEQPPGLLQR